MKAANLDSCEDWKKLVILILDEMHIREDLVYQKSTGKMIGFINLGDINNHILAFERSLGVSGEDKIVLANSIMMFMVRGLFTPLRFAYTQFPCANITGGLLFHPFWQAVFHLEKMGLKVKKLRTRSKAD